MNDSSLLHQLHDIQAPGAPGWWPPAPGWWLVLVAFLLLPLLLRRLWRIRRRRWRRHRVLAELERLNRRPDLDDTQFTAALSVLLKRTALLQHERHEIAALYGPDWLRFLDATGHCDSFTHGPGQALASVPYQPQARVDRNALTALARNWLQRNL